MGLTLLKERSGVRPDAADASASFSYFARSRTDAGVTLRVTAFADGRTLTRPAVDRDRTCAKRGTVSKI